MADFAEKTIAINGKQVIVRTNLNDGSYTARDSFNRTIAAGTATGGGRANFAQGNQDALTYVAGLPLGAANPSSSLKSDIVKNIIEKRNLDNINYLGNDVQKKLLSGVLGGYGNKISIVADTVPGAPPNPIPAAPNVPPTGADPTSIQTPNTNPELPPKNSTADPFGVFVYPTDLLVDDTSHVMFERIEYVASNLESFSKGVLGRPSERLVEANKLQWTYLPIPTSVNGQNTVGWGNDNLDIVKSLVGGGVAGLIEGGDALDTALGNIAGTVSANKEKFKKLLTLKVSGSIAGSDLFARATGAVVNNNLELLFSGPNLRTHSFTYRLTPRNSSEAIMIKKIIRSFKQSMAPILESGQLFLKTPNIYKITFMENASTQHSFLELIKPCALTGLNINYTPDNAYMTYGDNSPIAYEMQLQFSELEPIYSQDYDTAEGKKGMGF